MLRSRASRNQQRSGNGSIDNHRHHHSPSPTKHLTLPSHHTKGPTTARKKPSRLILRHRPAYVCLLVLLGLLTGFELVFLVLHKGSLSDVGFWKWLVIDAVPMDNYYTRPHNQNHPVPLLVGGSDGSGTRVFVKLLQELHVPMVVDDTGTLDMHATSLGHGQGWPWLVRQVFNVTHAAAGYAWEDLPEELRELAQDEVTKLLDELTMRGHQVAKNTTTIPLAKYVSWGFKAPVCMVLLPLFRHHLQSLKVLHVVRDGRDVALSENMSPVDKFFKVFYPDAEHRIQSLEHDNFGKESIKQIQAMQLWKDWNQQVYQYYRNETNATSLDYLTMRTEDLLQNPFLALQRLADFTGSPLSLQQLCCKSRTVWQDLGQSSSFTTDDGAPPENLDHFQDRVKLQQLPPRMQQVVDQHYAQWDAESRAKRQQVAEQGLAQQQPDSHKGALNRRLTEDDKIDVFASGGRKASPILHARYDPKVAARAAALAANLEGEEKFQHHHIMGGAAGRQGFNRIQQKLDFFHHPPGHGHTRQSSGLVQQRYGKWVARLANDPALSERLHLEGRQALETFGYEPSRFFMDTKTSSTFVCDDSVICSS